MLPSSAPSEPSWPDGTPACALQALLENLAGRGRFLAPAAGRHAHAEQQRNGDDPDGYVDRQDGPSNPLAHRPLWAYSSSVYWMTRMVPSMPSSLWTAQK